MCLLVFLIIGASLVAPVINLYTLTFLPVAISLLAYALYFDQNPSAVAQVSIAAWATVSWFLYILFFLGFIKLRVPSIRGGNISFGLNHQLVLLGAISAVVAFTFVSNIGGVYGYLEQAMDIRTAVADGHGLNPVDMGRPAFLHTLSLSILIYLSAQLASTISITPRSEWASMAFPVLIVILLAGLISFNDISRGRLLDVFILIVLGFVFASRNLNQLRRFKMLMKWGLAACSFLIAATMLQGKAAIWEGPISGAIGSLVTYLALPIYYFDEFLAGRNAAEPYSAFVGLVSIVQKLGAFDGAVLNDDRGLSLGGTDAILIYPMLKWWVSDFGLTAGVSLASAHLAIAGCLDAQVHRQYVSGDYRISTIWMLVAISAVWSLMTYKPLSVFYVLAWFLLVLYRVLGIFRAALSARTSVRARV